MDSDDDSKDDEEEINRLLQSNVGVAIGDTGSHNSRIDLSLYNPNKSVKHNTKILKNMIS